MLELEQSTSKRLKHLRVRVEMTDGDTVFLRGVPVNAGFFNKPKTNLLIKRPHRGMPFLVCVDENLEYHGSDQALVRAFAGGHTQQGWRVLLIGHDRETQFQQVVEYALEALGSEGREPVLKVSATPARTESGGGILAAFGGDLSEKIDIEQAEITVAREERIEEVVSCVLQWQVRMPIIAGESGVGKTNLLFAATRRLRQCRSSIRVIAVDLGALMAGTLFDSERENLLSTLLKEAVDAPDAVVALEHLEMALLGVPRGVLLLAQALDRGVRIVGTTLPCFQSGFEAAPLARRAHSIELDEMNTDETAQVLFAIRDRIVRHHRVQVDETLIPLVIDTARSLAGHLPAKAISLLDAAGARASLSGEETVSAYDVYLASARFREEE